MYNNNRTKKTYSDLGSKAARYEMLRNRGQAVFSGTQSEDYEPYTVTRGNKNLPKTIPQREYKPESLPVLSQQIEEANIYAQESKAKKKQAEDAYGIFLNNQTNTDHIDILKDGGKTSAAANAQKEIYWGNYQQAQSEAVNAERNAKSLQWDYNSRLKNPYVEEYLTEDLPQLNERLRQTNEKVSAAQAAVLAAEQRYNSHISRKDADELQMGTNIWTEDDEQYRQQLQKDWDDARQILADTQREQELISDTAIYRTDMETIANMGKLERIALETLTSGIDISRSIEAIHSLSEQERNALRSDGTYSLLLTNPEHFLVKQGYSKEDIAHIKESYNRFQHKESMMKTQETAEQIGDSIPLLGTLSTYPASLIGGIASDITAATGALLPQPGGYHSIDVNSPGYALSAYTESLRGTVEKNLGGIGGTIYNIANNTVDDIGKATVSAVTGLPLNYAGTTGEATRKAAIHGATPDRAFAIGLGDTADNVMIDTVLLGNPDDYRSTTLFDNAKNSIRQSAIDKVYESMPNNDIRYSQLVDSLIQQGLSEDEAKEAAYYHLIYGKIN